MKGSVLDFGDDSGELLRERGWDQLVDQLSKVASDPSPCPDDLFAVIVPGPRGSLRKFACNDKANTVLSAMYFRETGHLLPWDLRKMAAKNLVKACTWYGLTVPDYLRKAADITGTDLAPLSAKPKEEINAAQEVEVGLQGVKTTPDSIRKQAGERAMTETHRYADPRNGRYPLDSLSDVAEAGRYMDKYAQELGPRERRAMALQIEKRAQELGVPVAKSVRDLTRVKVASLRSIQGHLEMRRTYYGPDTEAGRLFGVLQTKVANLRPSVIAETIASIDEGYGGQHDWGRVISDPWSVVFEKRAEDALDFTYDLGGRLLPGTELSRLATYGLSLVANRFGKDFAAEFAKDPIGFFKHLPDPEKKVLANLTREQYSPGAPARAQG